MAESGSSMLTKLTLLLSFAVVALGNKTVNDLRAFYLVQQVYIRMLLSFPILRWLI